MSDRTLTDSAPPEITVGASASITRPITDADVVAFADVTGDHNPVHLDDDYARTTRFGERIAHGAYTLALVSAVLGMRLPGPGAVYVSQSAQFLRPARIGDEVTATVTVTALDPAKGLVTLSTVCINQRGKRLLTGEAVVLVEAILSRSPVQRGA